MELIEDLDPEEARSIVDPALKLMMEAVHRFGGFVAQSTGDGIFALFGAPVAHEDHPQRALYAALRMQEEIRRYSDRLRAEGRQPLQARVGVNTGEVVMRSVSTRSTTGRGTRSPRSSASTTVGSSHRSRAPGGKITGIRLWIVAMSSFGEQVTMAQVAERVPTSVRLKDQIPAKANGRLERRRMKNGVFPRPSFRHSYNPSATTRQRWRRKASRNIDEVATVSARALIGASFGSFADVDTKPQHIGPRRFSPSTRMIASTVWLGATL